MPKKQKTIIKPWGKEIIWAESSNYAAKIIYINHGHRLSRQYHQTKEETILVKSGVLSLEIGLQENIKTYTLLEGESFHIAPGMVHRFCAYDGNVALIEVSTPHLDDVIRLEDDYKR